MVFFKTVPKTKRQRRNELHAGKCLSPLSSSHMEKSHAPPPGRVTLHGSQLFCFFRFFSILPLFFFLPPPILFVLPVVLCRRARLPFSFGYALGRGSVSVSLTANCQLDFAARPCSNYSFKFFVLS